MYNMLEAMQVKFTKTDKLFLKNVRPDNLDVILSGQIIHGKGEAEMSHFHQECGW